MRDGAVGLAVAHDGPIGPARRIHQDVGGAFDREPFVGPRRGVALHVLSLGQRETGARQKAADRGDTLGLGGEGAIAGDCRVAEGFALLRRQRQSEVEPVRRQVAGGTVRPFQQRHGVFRCVLETEFGEFTGSRQPVEIGVQQIEPRQLIGLHDRESRARHLDGFVAGEMADQRTGEGGLAGPEVAGQGDQVAGLDRRGDVGHQPARRLLVLERRRKAESACTGGEHRIIRPVQTL